MRVSVEESLLSPLNRAGVLIHLVEKVVEDMQHWILSPIIPKFLIIMSAGLTWINIKVLCVFKIQDSCLYVVSCCIFIFLLVGLTITLKHQLHFVCCRLQNHLPWLGLILHEEILHCAYQQLPQHVERGLH